MRESSWRKKAWQHGNFPKKGECSLWGVKLKTIHRSSVLYMSPKKITYLPFSMDSLCWVMLHLIDLFRHLRGGMCLEPACGDEIEFSTGKRKGWSNWNRCEQNVWITFLHASISEGNQFFFDAENYFHGSVASSEPFIRKNRFICKLANHSRVKCTACLPVWIIAGFRTPFCYGVQIPLF